jgi:G3E family GTPase
MQLIVVSGFLGSGKTTAMLSFARELAAEGRKVAIIVNEIGAIGIDNVLLKQIGANVWEILGGCICCTLAGELGSTLTRLAADFAPEIVLLEPSGASHPDTIKGVLRYAQSASVSATKWLAVIDPLRLEELVDVLQPLLESQVQTADAVIITKSDVATMQQLDAAKTWALGLQPGLACFVADMKNPARALSLKEALPCLN